MMTAALAIAGAAKKSRKKNRFVAGIDLDDCDEGKASSSSSSSSSSTSTLCSSTATPVLDLTAPNVSLNEPVSQINVPKAGRAMYIIFISINSVHILPIF